MSAHNHPQPSYEEKKKLLRKIWRSVIFQRARKRRRLFVLLVRLEMTNALPQEFTNQSLLQKLYQKENPRGLMIVTSTGNDSTLAKAQISNLRKDLEKYAQTEGRDDPWRILIADNCHVPQWIDNDASLDIGYTRWRRKHSNGALTIVYRYAVNRYRFWHVFPIASTDNPVANSFFARFYDQQSLIVMQASSFESATSSCDRWARMATFDPVQPIPSDHRDAHAPEHRCDDRCEAWQLDCPTALLDRLPPVLFSLMKAALPFDPY